MADELGTKRFWSAALIRALRTLAQTVITLAAGDGGNVFHVSWRAYVFVGVGSALLSICTSIVVGIPEAPSED